MKAFTVHDICQLKRDQKNKMNKVRSSHYLLLQMESNLYEKFEHLQHTLTTTFPDTFSISPKIADRNEDFPQPTDPTTATSFPSGTLTVIL